MRRFKKDLLLYRKKQILDHIIHNPKFSMEKIYPGIYEKFKSINHICIIGNGPIKTNISLLIDQFDYIIRFNNYLVDNDISLLGKRTDLHIICLPCEKEHQVKIVDSWLQESEIIMPFEIGNPHRYNLLSKSKYIDQFKCPNITFINEIKKFNIDITRGFFGLAFALQMKFKVNKNLKIYIIGFGGKGHHFNPKIKIHHNHEEEKEIISILMKKKLLFDLNECEELPNIQKTHISLCNNQTNEIKNDNNSQTYESTIVNTNKIIKPKYTPKKNNSHMPKKYFKYMDSKIMNQKKQLNGKSYLKRHRHRNSLFFLN